MKKNLKKQLALFKQTTICDNRDLSFTSLKIVAVLAFFFGFLNIHTGFGTAGGLQALEILYVINLLLLPVVCIALFLPVIIEERKNQTMGLLMMTGLDAFGYLAGKCGSRFVLLLMLTALQIPFAIVSVALGGITVEMVLLVYIYTLAYSFCLTGLFIMCSLFFSDFFKGLLFGSLVCIFILIFNYTLVETGEGHYGLDHYMEEAFEALFEVGMDNITRNWGSVGLESYAVYIVCFISFGLLFLYLTFRNFNRKSMQINAYDFTKKTKGFFNSFLPKSFTSRERFKTNNPIFSKDYYYIMHGRLLTILQTLIIFSIMGYTYYEISASPYYSDFQHFKYAMEVGLVTSYLAILVLVWYAANRLWYEEIQAMTFNSLKMTPRPINELFRQKLKVVLRCVMPSAVIFICLLAFILSQELHLNEDAVLIGFFFVTTIPAAFYVTMYISLFVNKMRYIVSIVAGILIFTGEIFLIETFRGAEEQFIFICSILQVVLAGFLHFACQNHIKNRYLE